MRIAQQNIIQCTRIMTANVRPLHLHQSWFNRRHACLASFAVSQSFLGGVGTISTRLIHSDHTVTSVDTPTSSDPVTSDAIPSPVVTRYVCVVEYDGSEYHGWSPSIAQREKERSVAGAIEVCLSHLCHLPAVRIFGSGRTDRGVHGLGQVFHVDIDLGLDEKGNMRRPISTEKFLSGCNHFLRTLGHSSIQLLHVSIAPGDLAPREFHARHSAVSRSYVYRVWNAPQSSRRSSIWLHGRAWHIGDMELDCDRMNQALELIRGRHDFTIFQSAGCEATSSVREMTQASMEIERGGEASLWFDATERYRDPHVPSFPPRLLSLHFTSRSFLYHQIRNLVGIVVAVGKGTVGLDRVKDMLLPVRDENEPIRDSSQDPLLIPHRQLVGQKSAPPQGLYLRQIDYPWNLRDWKANSR